MQISTIKSVVIGLGTAAAVIAVTGAASGSGVGAVFNLGKTNKVNATSSLTGSTKHSMLAVTNSGSGAALNLHVGRGKAPLSVNSSTRVANLNASLLGGLAASQFVQGGGQSRSFGFTMAPTSSTPRSLLSVPGFGTFMAQCENSGGTFADVTFATGSRAIDSFITTLDSASEVGVRNSPLPANDTFAIISSSVAGETVAWGRLMLRYTTGSGSSLITHVATADVMVAALSSSCDFDASAIIGPGVKAP